MPFSPHPLPHSGGFSPPEGLNTPVPATGSYAPNLQPQIRPRAQHFDQPIEAIEDYNSTPMLAPIDRASSPRRVPAPKVGNFRRRFTFHLEPGRGLQKGPGSDLPTSPRQEEEDDTPVSVPTEAVAPESPQKIRLFRFLDLGREESSEVPEEGYESSEEKYAAIASPLMSFSFDVGGPQTELARAIEPVPHAYGR